MSNPIPHRAVPVDPAASERVVASLCDAAGMPMQDEFDRDGVAALLRSCGYDCTPGVVAEFVRKSYISEPEVWTAPYVHALTAALECRRRWLPTPNVYHDPKKSAQRLEIERLQNEGVNPPIDDLDQHTVEDLLIQLVQHDQRHVREALYECLRFKLDGFEE
jgi:hypothetical protein